MKSKISSQSADTICAYGVQEFAGLIGVSGDTVRREIKAGHLKAMRVRRRLLIAGEEGLRYLRAVADEA